MRPDRGPLAEHLELANRTHPRDALPSVGSKDEHIERSVPQSICTPPQISPPPLKRKRRDVMGDDNSPNPRTQSVPIIALKRRSSAPGPHPTQFNRNQKQDDGKSMSDRITQADILNDRRRTCHKCKRPIDNTARDPRVKCSSCHRSFHDLCRGLPRSGNQGNTPGKSWICLKCTAHQRKSTRALDNTKACTEKRPKSPTASPNPSQSNADRLHVLAPPIAKRLPGYAKEIPNTPDQGNGVLVHEIMAPLLSQPAANIPSSLSTIDNVMTASQTDLGNRVLCYSCKKLLVLSKNIENVACLQCRIGKSIIPETPEATAHQRRSGDDSGEARIGSTRVPVNGPIDGTPPFQARFSVISSIATAPLPGQRSAANVNPQVRDDDIGVQEHNHSQGRQSLSKPQNRQQEVQEKDIEVENRERPSSIGRVDKQAATGTSDIAVQTDLPEKTSTEMRISMSASEIHTENQATINSRSTDTSEIVVPCIVQGLSADHLAGLAILAAGDVPWTNTQVVDWVADNFPTHRRGDWSWENSVCSSLSSKRFQSVKKPGIKDTAYKFSSAEICAFYKGMSALINIPLSSQAHSVFAITTPPAHSQAQDEDFEHLISRGDLTAQDKPQEDMYELFTANQDSSVQYHAQAVSEQLTPIEDSSAPEIGGFYMPFEKSTLFRATNDVDPAPHVRRERSFHKAFPEYVKPTIDTMSEADINAKIAEIRKRPSRKQVWGSRLAFKRCRGRNIHDETKGKWHPRIPVEMNENEVAIAAAKNAWREALGFPQSPIPMLHQGQLAFRDGTLVNGKLPRPRVVYKVGSKFGNGLKL